MSKVNLSYSLLQASEWGIDGCFYCYSSVFLLSCGLSNTSIGIILGIALALSFLGQIFLGEFFNAYGQKTLVLFFKLGGLFLLLSSFLLLLGMPDWLAILFFVICCLFIQIFPAFMNSAAMYEIQHGVSINYGLGRGSGSIGYAICSVLIGQLLSRHEISIIFSSGIFLSLLFLISSHYFFQYAEKCRSLNPDSSSLTSTSLRKENKLNFQFLKKYKKYTIILAGIVLLMTGHTYMSNYLYQIISSKGGNEASMGIASAIAACCEVPALFLFHHVKHKLHSTSWFMLSCIILTSKMLFAFFSQNLLLLQLSETLQVGFGLFTVSSVYYTGSIIPKEDTINSQAYLNAATTLGVLLSLLSGGYIIDHLGTSTLLLIGTLILTLGSTIIFSSFLY